MLKIIYAKKIAGLAGKKGEKCVQLGTASLTTLGFPPQAWLEVRTPSLRTW